MSMEMRVYFAGKPPSCEALEHTLIELGLPFKITEHVDLEKHGGYLPMIYGEGDDAVETGAEVDFYPGAPTISELNVEGVDPSCQSEIAFRTGGDIMEAAAAGALAAAIAQITGGVVYDDSEGALQPLEEATQIARTNLADGLTA
jgi:hypothetical protein